MDYTCKTRSLQSLNKAILKDNIRLNHELQREEGQWNRKAKSDLIDSLLRHYPINPTYAIKQSDTLFIIDGVQRLSTIRDYLADKFALSKDMESVIVDNQEVNLSGLKFSKLADNIQDAILNAELQVYELSNCTEKDIREIFRRQNAGKPLNPKQLRVVYESDEFGKVVYELANHPFMKKLITPTQKKNGANKDLIIQTIMLVASNQEQEFTSFRVKDMNSFVADYADQYIERTDILKETLDKFDEAFDENIKLPATSIPQILYSGYRIVKDKKSFSKLVEEIINFINTYDVNDGYRQFVQSGTSNQENVKGRFDYWRGVVRSLQ